MKKIVGASLISALIIMSCQKKEEQSVQTEPQQTAQTEQSQPQKQETQQEQQQQTVATSQQPQKAEPEQEKKESQQKQSEEKTKPQQTASIDGKSIFVSKGCGACHQESADTVGPSLKKISSAYGGDRGKLTAFLKGEGKAIVDPAKEAIMKPQLEVTKKLSTQELEALVDFILKH